MLNVFENLAELQATESLTLVEIFSSQRRSAFAFYNQRVSPHTLVSCASWFIQ